jgi:two-component system, LytTR family, response regulator
MMRCLAIDDERLVLDLLVDNIRQIPFLTLVKACRNAMEATAVLQEEKIDLIFVDIQMPKLSGLQFIQTLAQPPLVILITAYEQYALEGYTLNAVDYLLKPVAFDRFLKACNKANELFTLRNRAATEQSDPSLQQDQTRQQQTSQPHITSAADEASGSLFVNVEYTLVRIPFADILFIESLKDYMKIHLSSSNRPVITKMSLKAMEEKLPSSLFIRIHKSYIVSVNRITVIKRDLVCIGQHELPVSDFYKDNIQRIIKG